MKPEGKKNLEQENWKEEFTELGIPEEWIEPLQKLGYINIDKLKEVEKPGKLHQKMMGYRKK